VAASSTTSTSAGGEVFWKCLGGCDRCSSSSPVRFRLLFLNFAVVVSTQSGRASKASSAPSSPLCPRLTRLTDSAPPSLTFPDFVLDFIFTFVVSIFLFVGISLPILLTFSKFRSSACLQRFGFCSPLHAATSTCSWCMGSGHGKGSGACLRRRG